MKIKFNLSEFSISKLTRTFTIASIMASVIALFSGPVYAQSYDATTQAGQEIKFEYELSIAPNWQLRYTVKTEDQSATAGEDYDGIDKKFVFPAGDKTLVVKTDTHANNDSTGSERFKLKFSDLEVPGQTAGTWVSAQFRNIPSSFTMIGEIVH